MEGVVDVSRSAAVLVRRQASKRAMKAYSASQRGDALFSPVGFASNAVMTFSTDRRIPCTIQDRSDIMVSVLCEVSSGERGRAGDGRSREGRRTGSDPRNSSGNVSTIALILA